MVQLVLRTATSTVRLIDGLLILKDHFLAGSSVGILQDET